MNRVVRNARKANRMAIQFDRDRNNVYIHSDLVETCEEDQRLASNHLLHLLEEGCHFPQNPMLRRGKRRLRVLRREGELREFGIDEEIGLPILNGPRIERMPDGRVLVWLPDWDCMTRTRITFGLHRIEGQLVLLPLRPNLELLDVLYDRHLRLIKGWSQSFIEKHAREIPGLKKEPGRLGERFAVDTVTFFQHFNHPRYPFMASHLAPFNPVAEACRLLSRVSA